LRRLLAHLHLATQRRDLLLGTLPRGLMGRSQRDSTAPAKSDAPPTAETPRTRGITADTDELENGWRRLPGGYVIPPPDPRLTAFVDPEELRRL
jgi:hypothetical protein